MTVRPSWDEYFLLLAKIISTRSTCLSRPSGAVVVRDKRILATGYNGSMPGVKHCLDEGKCFRRSINAPEHDKYNFCRSIHAEANAIAYASRMGVSLNGATLYTTLAPCFVCLKLLVNAGIKKVFYELPYKSKDKERDNFWLEQIKEVGLESECLVLSDSTKSLAVNSIQSITSQRRLKSV
ncbi:MAG: dCMP deaminase family protein [archaeon]